MKVSIELSPEYSEPYAIIYADKITDSIQRTLDIFGSNESPITAFKNENDIVILQPKEIYMVKVENKDTIIYGKEHYLPVLPSPVLLTYEPVLSFFIYPLSASQQAPLHAP